MLCSLETTDVHGEQRSVFIDTDSNVVLVLESRYLVDGHRELNPIKV